MVKVADSVLALVGNTPTVRLRRIVEEGWAEVLVKLEGSNPAGSVKDRVALAMIEAAERDGRLSAGDTIVEPTSGNTGIGLALIAAVKGYRLIITMPDDSSEERRALLAHYGAQVVLTPGRKLMAGAIARAKEIVRDNPRCFMPQQFDNPANPETHRQTTAKEILEATNHQLHAFVAGVGTGGTVTGVGSALKRELPDIRVVAVEPESSAVLSGKKPRPHAIQGIGAGFVPSVFDREAIDEVRTCEDRAAYDMAGRLAREEGISAGLSGGAAVHVALSVAQELGAGKRIVAVIPDTWDRYISVEPPVSGISGLDFII